MPQEPTEKPILRKHSQGFQEIPKVLKNKFTSNDEGARF